MLTGDRVAEGGPGRIAFGLFLAGLVVEFGEQVDALWRADEDGPAHAVGQGGLG